MRHLCEKPLEAHEIWFARRIRGQACGRPSSCASRRRISRSPGTVPRAVARRSCLAMRFAGEDLNEQGAALGNHLLQTAPRGSVAPLAPEFQKRSSGEPGRGLACGGDKSGHGAPIQRRHPGCACRVRPTVTEPKCAQSTWACSPGKVCNRRNGSRGRGRRRATERRGWACAASVATIADHSVDPCGTQPGILFQGLLDEAEILIDDRGAPWRGAAEPVALDRVAHCAGMNTPTRR